MNIEKYKNLIETLPKESEELWFEYNLEVNKILQENQKYKEVIDKLNESIIELSDNTDDTTCYDIDRDCKNDLLDILKEVE